MRARVVPIKASRSLAIAVALTSFASVLAIMLDSARASLWDLFPNTHNVWFTDPAWAELPAVRYGHVASGVVIAAFVVAAVLPWLMMFRRPRAYEVEERSGEVRIGTTVIAARDVTASSVAPDGRGVSIAIGRGDKATFLEVDRMLDARGLLGALGRRFAGDGRVEHRLTRGSVVIVQAVFTVIAIMFACLSATTLGRWQSGIVITLAVLLTIVWMRARPSLHHTFAGVAAVDDPQFTRTLEALMGAPLKDGNAVRELSNGDEIFPVMLEAIRSATRTIDFESYIYWSGRVGNEFADALIERAHAGVKVNLLIDWMGSHQAEAGMLDRMRAAGVDVGLYNPPRLTTLLDFNNRTHRKLLVIDGKVGFTGGVGISDTWSGHADSPEHWRDEHFRIEGPTVAQMQATFMDNWVELRPDIHDDRSYFPELLPVGSIKAQVIHSAPNGGSLKIRLMYGLFVGGSRKTLRIANAYFVPEDAAIDELVLAARRGVKVELIVPGPITDSQTIRRASRAKWGKLLAAGVALYEFLPTMFHCKVMIVDDLWVSVGSTNFDNRSFRINDEANLNIRDEMFATKQAAKFEEDKTKAPANRHRRSVVNHCLWPFSGIAGFSPKGGPCATVKLEGS